MDEITIHVTQEDIDRGNRNYSNSCAVALAGLRDLFLDEGTIHVSYTYLAIFNKKNGLVMNTTLYDLPAEAQQFIESFDLGASVEPFKFIAARNKGGNLR